MAIFFVIASILTIKTASGQEWLDDEDCVGPGCCHEKNDEMSRQFVCSMLAYLDLDPLLRMEGCRKHRHTCRAVCEGPANKQMTEAFEACDTKYDKDTALVDWYGCFFEALLSGAVNAVVLKDMETTEPKEATGNFCQLWTQPGCPLCVAMRLSTNPCSFPGVSGICPRTCRKCKCHPPSRQAFRAQLLTCSSSSDASWGETCSVVCSVNSAAQGELECVEGDWRGTAGDPSCKFDCRNTGLSLPEKGTQLRLAGGGACDRMQHGERCFVSCEEGTTASAWWECNDGAVHSSQHPAPPACLTNCGKPPLPSGAAKFGSCSNPALEFGGRRRLEDPFDERQQLARRLSSNIFVPQTVASGSSCELSCSYPYTPSRQYLCWNGSYIVPECTTQLFQTGWQWPVPQSEVVSPLGGVYLNYNLDVLLSVGSDALGKSVDVCSLGGLGCPMASECFAEVPLEDTGRITTTGSQLRVRMGHGTEALQMYGCEYTVTVPENTVLAMVNTSVGNKGLSWSYRLVPPPPRLVKLSVEPSYMDVIVVVQYDIIGTIRCIATAPGEKPLQKEFDFLDSFMTQTMPDMPIRMKLEGLEEFTEYDVHCQGFGSRGAPESLFSVHNNSVRFKTQTRTPYAYDVQAVQIDNTRVTLSILYSTECKVTCVSEQHPNASFDRMKLAAALLKAEPVEFRISRRELEITNLVPGMPTQILCRGTKEIGREEFLQPWSDAWAYALTVETLAMTSTALEYLNATGCELVPPFSPTTPIYACALPKNVQEMTVQLSAAVPSEAYSQLDCKGEWRKSCAATLQVEAAAPKTWHVRVKSQVGHVEPYVVVAMNEAKVVPREIRPKIFPASNEAPNMTICAAAENDALPTNISQVTAMLIPGNWELTVHELHVGSNLPSCNCSDCNLEVLLGVRGAGLDLIVVLFISGFPGFTLDEPMRVHFESPEVLDVDPPTASMYDATELIVRGANFGHSADVGARILVEKIGPPFSLPPLQWFGNCPKMKLQIGDADIVNASWAEAEFNGVYTKQSATRYEMSREARVQISFAQYMTLPFGFRLAGPAGPAQPVELEGQLRDALIDEIGMCCYERLGALRIEYDKDNNRILVVERLGRRMPQLRLAGKSWDLVSRAVRNLRVNFKGLNLGISDGWVLLFSDDYPGPRKYQKRWGDRRLAGKRSPADLYELASAWTDGGLSTDFGFLDGLGASDRQLQEEEGGNETEPECKDDSKGMRRFLDELNIDIPGVGWFATCGLVTSLAEGICFMLKYVCCDSCKDWKPRREEEPVKLFFQCERCGDGVMVGEEQCDDSNLRDGDGCSFLCKVEEGWSCSAEGCRRKDGLPMPARNLCGETTWIDDKSLRCKLSAGARWPLALHVDVHAQTSVPINWVQYAQPAITSFQALTLSDRIKTSVLEFVGKQQLRLTGRGLPPSNIVAQRTPVSLVIGSFRLCGDLEVLSSSEALCSMTQVLSLDELAADPEVTIRVDEVSSKAVPLSGLGLHFRRPRIISMTPTIFNDTDVKALVFNMEHSGLPLHGTLHVKIGNVNCTVMLHTSKLVHCSLGYIPVGKWPVHMYLGNLPAESGMVVTSMPTLCPVGMRRADLETSECKLCHPGTAEPNVNANFTCPDCADSFYQNATGATFCRQCTDHAFSVWRRSSVQHCRCQSGYFHAYGDEMLAEKCSACELSRGFGWPTLNWTIDCEDCKFRYAKNPMRVREYGPCHSECYGLTCTPCPFGAVCFGNAAWPRVLPGFWTDNVYKDDASKIQRCMPMEACLGDDGEGRMLCREGYDGVRCGVCVLGYYKEQHECVICPDNQWLWGMFFLIFFLLVVIFGVIPAQIVFMCYLLGIKRRLPLIWRLACAGPQCCISRCCCCYRSRPRQQLQPASSCSLATKLGIWNEQMRAAPLLRTLSMCLNFGQTCYAFSMLQRPAVAWPAASWELLSWTKLLTADVEFMKPDCIVPLPFFTKWVGKIAFPAGIVVLLSCVTIYLAWSLRQEIKRIPTECRPSIWNAFCFTLALVIHVSLIWHLKVVLSPVDCNWCREGVTCLDEHTLVECWTDDPTWKAMMLISIIDFVCISGSFLVLLTALILYAWRSEEDLTMSRSGLRVSVRMEASKFRSFTSFFVSGYRGSKQGGNLATFSWELLILYRKLALLLSAKFTTLHPVRGANLQLFFLLASLMGQWGLRPYQDLILNRCDSALNLLQFLVLLSACQLTMGVGQRLEEVYKVLNIASLFGGAAFAICICLWKLILAWRAATSEGDQEQALPEDKGNSKVPDITLDHVGASETHVADLIGKDSKTNL